MKILDDKIKTNKAQYDLDREADEISALSSGELETREYLTGGDLGYKPDVIQKAKFEYSPLGTVFNKELDESDKKEGLLKRLKNIEGKNEQQLEATKDQGERQLEALSGYDATNKSQNIEFDIEKNQEAKELVDEIKEISRNNKNKTFACFHSNGTLYNFNKFRDIKQLGNDIVNGHISIKHTKDEQDEMKEKIAKLENCNPTNK